MKKILLLIIHILAFGSLSAQETGNVHISDLTIDKEGENVVVSFTAGIDKKAAPRGTVLVYAPVITNGEYKVSLPPVVVQGRGARRAWERAAWISGETVNHPDAVYAGNGSDTKYIATVPFQLWMYGSRIEAETITAGCCDVTHGISAMAANVLPVPLPEPEPEPVEPEKTVAEVLSETFSFVLPASDFDPAEPIKFYDDERDNALTIYFKINNYDIDAEYAGNEQTLINLIASIELIETSADVYVDRVVVAGFASPEGPFELNDRLAWERAVSVKEYIMKNTGMDDRTITLFNGSADWRGLRLLVSSDGNMPDREKVLYIIDNYPVWDSKTQTGRMTMIRNLSAGKTYGYMTENILPRLRNGTFIRVYFDDK